MFNFVQTALVRYVRWGVFAASIAMTAACGGGGGGGGGGNTSNAQAQSAANVGLNVVITPSRISGVAPLSVFFDASDSEPTTTKAFHTLHFEWDFDDPTAGVWQQGTLAGTSSKNKAFGPVASHLFEKHGTYNVTLTVKKNVNDPGTSKQVQIEVKDPAEEFKFNTVCFATAAPFTDCPAGATQVVTSDFASAINTYQATKKRLLFKAGNVFSSTAEATVNTAGAGYIGKFGAGSNPKFLTTSTTAFFKLSQSLTPTIKDWRIVDLELDGQDGAAMGFNFGGGIDQVTLLRINMHNIKSGVNNSADQLDNYNAHANVNYHGHTLWDAFAVIDSQINVVNAGVAVGGQIGAYISGKRHSFMGNVVDPAYGGEHAVRNPYLDRAVVSHNYMARPAATKHSWTLRGANQASSGIIGSGMATQKIVAAENIFFNDKSPWTVTVAPQNTIVDERIQDVIVERNYFKSGIDVQAALVTRGPVKNLTFRNNVINLTNSASGAIGVSASGASTISVPASTGHSFVNNTVYRGDAVASFGAFSMGGNANKYTFYNNMAYAPSASSVDSISGSTDDTPVLLNNSSAAQIKIDPLFALPVDGSEPTLLNFKPQAASYAMQISSAVFTYVDALHRNIVSSKSYMGAISAD